MIREAVLGDKEFILRTAHEYTQLYPETMKWDYMKVSRLASLVIGSERHFCQVAEDEHGEVKGVLAALTTPGIWYQRGYASVLLWVTDEPGTGATMLRNFRQWAKDRPAVRVAGMSPDCDEIDPRAWALAERVGFARRGGALVLFC